MADDPRGSSTSTGPTDEIGRALAELERLAGDPEALAAVPEALRLRLRVAAGRLARPDRESQRRLNKALRRRARGDRRAHDLAILASRATRSAQRNPVVAAGVSVPALPFRAPFVAWSTTPSGVPEGGETDRRTAPGNAPGDVPDGTEAAAGDDLREPRDCYVCKRPYRRVHPHYHALCPECGALNWEKRAQTARLDGRVAVVTGGRVKIGYQIVLKLLRAGAGVVATTRFPHDAALRFAREPDHGDWCERLQVHGLDLRHLPSVEHFAGYLARTLRRLDFLVNNAAQTVRRPAAFYRHLLAVEEQSESALPEAARALLGRGEALRSMLAAGGCAEGALVAPGAGGGEGRFAPGVVSAARLSQLALLPEDRALVSADFPIGRLDGDLQQIDLRRVNSWRLTAAGVSTPELIEVHLVNALSPFLLCARLKALMARERTGDRHVVNVSAMEASFSRRKKTDKHPHTNMAKAALNMLTRTAAADYLRDGIHMNSVDTGWVTDEDPLQHVARKQAVHDFHPPLDAVDGAARVLDPIFTGFLTGHHSSGQFFKDYRPVDW